MSDTHDVISAPIKLQNLIPWEQAAEFLELTHLGFQGYVANRPDFPPVRYAAGFGNHPHYRLADLQNWKAAQQKEKTS
jgi:hypothetical protein